MLGLKRWYFRERVGGQFHRNRLESTGWKAFLSKSSRIARGERPPHFGAGGEAWGRSWGEPAVFKHRRKLPRHQEPRTTNGKAFEGDT
jgi:hypothetical protein